MYVSSVAMRIQSVLTAWDVSCVAMRVQKKGERDGIEGRDRGRGGMSEGV